jgi:GT2 family glycosyltransferase
LESKAQISQNLRSFDNKLASDKLCSLCDCGEWTYLFVSHGMPVYRCSNCGLVRLHPQPTRSEIQTFYADGNGRDQFAEDDLGKSRTEQEAASSYLRILQSRGVPKSGILLVAPKQHPFATIAKGQAYEVEICLDVEELGQTRLADAHYSSAVVVFQLERITNPMRMLRQIRAALRPDGTLLLVTPSLDSWSARFFRSQWTEWRPENLYYFDAETIQSILLKSGFARIRLTRDRRRYSLQHLYDRARAFPRTGLTRLVRSMYHLVPPFLRRSVRLELPASGMIATGQCAEPRTRPQLSVVMPVYNEVSTFATTMDAVLAKEMPGIDKEIIVVESNSTDGTRELVSKYQNYPGVKVLLEDRPRGKGSAVRAAFRLVKGDYILIQDADAEYDVNDYDALIEPLQKYQRAFVLGSRHVGDWKVRQLNDQPGMAAFLNVGHFLFGTLFNVLYKQDLKDPFTMYKVFRKDCLTNLGFECNRFDFDFELVIKLLRKGYRPLEIPVNYKARSFKEGKKISVFRDSWNLLVTIIKYRYAPIYFEPEQPEING